MKNKIDSILITIKSALLSDSVYVNGPLLYRDAEESLRNVPRYLKRLFTRCQLTRELLKNGFSRTFISNSLLDEDIRDDGMCALKVFEQEGFKYWSRWEARCKGQVLPDIEKCPDWQYPSNRSSPPRDKRTLRGRRSALRRKRFTLQLEQTKK
ncbi:hypothetical protein RR48_03140 [Papilio machaon]|uniref:Uncharacterized protein n=1 Tax=Papilio machaon TaxID=76193 RepID=A0A0N1IHY7_PAPMA|nr:hypothetical protein RR48_03140 [Papilio machaon]